jgi:hypothetical protein
MDGSGNGTKHRAEAPPDTSPGPYTGEALQTTGFFSLQPLMHVEGDRLVLPDLPGSETSQRSSANSPAQMAHSTGSVRSSDDAHASTTGDRKAVRAAVGG